MSDFKVVEREDRRAEELQKHAAELWDIEDPEDCEDMVHAALGIIGAAAMLWNPYWVIGLMEANIRNILILVDGGDGDE